jgi:diguanylate cyclase (GGDEF)-like protein
MSASVISLAPPAIRQNRRRHYQSDSPAISIDGAMVAHLVEVVQELSLARTLTDVHRLVGQAARELTGCDGATFILREGAYCYYADENAIAPLWKGRRIPSAACISGWVMQHRSAIGIADIYEDPRISREMYHSTFVKSLAMAPIRAADPIGAIGVYWADRHDTTRTEMLLLQALADSTSIAVQNVVTRADLDKALSGTQALISANQTLERLALIDELTGIYNRRGFYDAVRRAADRGTRALVLFIDIDGLKEVNDRLGHAAGDQLISSVAAALRKCFRQHDVVGRLGGDEFCVVVSDPAMDPATLREILFRRLDEIHRASEARYRASVSVGIVEATSEDLREIDRLVARADSLMYGEKQAKRAVQ